MERSQAKSGIGYSTRAALPRVLWLSLAFGTLLFAGCDTMTGFPSSRSMSDPLPYAPYAGSAAAPVPSETTKPAVCSSAPHTLPEALCAYCRCLQCGPPPQDKGSAEKKASAEQASKTDKTKDDDKGQEDKAKKSPSPDKDKEKDTSSDKNGDKDTEKEPEEPWYSAHAQATAVTQVHSNFSPPYTGPHSLLPSEPMATSMTGTLFLDTRLWEGGELIFNPEIAGGTGFSAVDGIAGFTNGEITRVGVVEPSWYFARLYLQQTIGLGGEQEDVKDEPNQIAGKQDVDRFTLKVGRFAATDIVDDNRYAHDPRSQFLNWTLLYNGAWDYPSNVRGYTDGIALEFNRKYWTLSYGIVAEPSTANGAPLDPHILKAHGQFLELEQRYDLGEHPGSIRFLGYMNNAHMGKYREALDEMPVDPDVTATQAYRIKYGFGISWDQELTRALGVFGRLGWNNGQTETWAYTPIDATASLGMALKGTRWCRPDDVVGLGGAINGLSDAHRDYLAAGGLDFNIGDGKLSYGNEKIVELYYLFQIYKGIQFTVDFQEIDHPAYNRDRGPVSVGSMRFHLEY